MPTFSLRRWKFALIGGLLFAQGAAHAQDLEKWVLPDVDRTRRERLEVVGGRRVMVPEQFVLEQVADNALVGSIVNMTFDHRGRPALSQEGAGIVLLEDLDSDGTYDSVHVFADQIRTAHGMHFIGPGDLLVNSEGPRGTGLYRLTDTDGDDKADEVILIAPSRGGIGEHGPHTIMSGADGYLYALYGNHAYPDLPSDPKSPSRRMREDQFLPRYLDPRGHANRIRVPGGTIHRFDLETKSWSQFCGGFRNPFDMAMNHAGEIFTYDSDMEWDYGLPWFRPTRLIHCIPGGDYGWRTGSGKLPFYQIDTLPGVDNIGRGSPVGTAFYYHDHYPAAFRGAVFLGDWSRGRVRVNFPRRAGATYLGKTYDFVLGEPLNVTDLDIGPDGNLYFSVGGRKTTGGLFRVRYTGPSEQRVIDDPIERVVYQPMPRSAWGKLALTEAKENLGSDWGPKLAAYANDSNNPSEQRLRALEALQVYGPKPEAEMLGKLVSDPDPEVRAGALFHMGTRPLDEVRPRLLDALEDEHPLVARRAAESLVRAGLDENIVFEPGDPLPPTLFNLLDHEDRFVRYAARLSLMRIDRRVWANAVASDSIARRPRGALEGLLALTYTQGLVRESDRIFDKLESYSLALTTGEVDEQTLLSYLRVLQMAFIRDLAPGEPGRQGLMDQIGPRLLALFPTENLDLNRELQVVLAYMETPGAVGALLDYMTPEKSREEQIHTAYALRTIENGWTRADRRRMVEWFDRGRDMGGAASMAGYIENIWKSTLENLPEGERRRAEQRKERALAERAERAAKLMAEIEGDRPPGQSDLVQMSFKELREYLEYDIMTYERGNAERGERVFRRAKCIDCHVFGTIGRGGGPDLSTVVSRFRRGEILESIMYPSRVISDQYTALNLRMKNNETLSGMLAAEGDGSLTLITATGERVEIQKSEIVERRPSEVSIMPEGLLGTMNLGDLVDLILFLERGSDI